VLIIRDQGMEDLIKQAFLHVDVIGPHVQEGHYDLLGPNGEIILPSVWEKVVEPDWAITMHMWPMDKNPLRGAPPPGGMPMGARDPRLRGMGPPPPGGMRPPGRPPFPGVPPPPGWPGPGRMMPNMRGPPGPAGGPDIVTVGPRDSKKKSSKPGGGGGGGGGGFMSSFMSGKPSKSGKKWVSGRAIAVLPLTDE